MRPSISVVELEARDLPAFFGNNLFPDDSAWNQKITDAPIAAKSIPPCMAVVPR